MFTLVLPMLLALTSVPVSLTAERVVHENTRELTLAEGRARLSTADSVLTAERIHYDGKMNAATAVGSVTFRTMKGGPLLVFADVVTVRFVDGEVDEVFIQDGYALRKTIGNRDAFLKEDSKEALEAMGPTTLRVSGNHLKRSESGWQVDALDLTPCDCSASSATWRVHANRAVVNLEGDRVSAFGPAIYVGSVPVLWFPWLSLPLSGRQTGLLVPKPDFGPLNGFSLDWPLFITLGRSADLTLTPGFFTGGTGAYGVQGPRLLTEVRYQPSTRAGGRVTLGTLYDFRAQRDPVDASALDPNRKSRGLRFDGSLKHLQTWDDGWGARADGSAVSDGYLFRDITTDVLAREAGYLRSSVSLFRRTDHAYAQVDVTVRQDLTYGYGLWSTPYVAENSPAFGPNPLQRLPALTLALPERQLAGPLSASLFVEAARLAPLTGLTGDEGPGAFEGFGIGDPNQRLSTECLAQRLYKPGPIQPLCPAELDVTLGKAGQGDRIYQAGEREARDRLMVFPRVAVRGNAGRFLSADASAGWRQSVWVGEASGNAGQRGYPVLSAGLETALAKRFGEGEGGLNHKLSPRVEVRAVPLTIGSRPAPYDELDTASGYDRRVWQGMVGLRQRLTREVENQARPLLQLDVGQQVDLRNKTVGEAFAWLESEWGLFRGGVGTRFDVGRQRLTQVSAKAELDLGAGRGFWAGYDNLADEGTGETARPLDLLFGSTQRSPGRAQMIKAGARWQWKTFRASYEMLWLDQVFTAASMGARPMTAITLTQHSASVSWAPACDCWRLDVSATQTLDGSVKDVASYGVPQFSASLTVSGFGTFGK